MSQTYAEIDLSEFNSVFGDGCTILELICAGYGNLLEGFYEPNTGSVTLEIKLNEQFRTSSEYPPHTPENFKIFKNLTDADAYIQSNLNTGFFDDYLQDRTPKKLFVLPGAQKNVLSVKNVYQIPKLTLPNGNIGVVCDGSDGIHFLDLMNGTPTVKMEVWGEGFAKEAFAWTDKIATIYAQEFGITPDQILDKSLIPIKHKTGKNFTNWRDLIETACSTQRLAWHISPEISEYGIPIDDCVNIMKCLFKVAYGFGNIEINKKEIAQNIQLKLKHPMLPSDLILTSNGEDENYTDITFLNSNGQEILINFVNGKTLMSEVITPLTKSLIEQSFIDEENADNFFQICRNTTPKHLISTSSELMHEQPKPSGPV